MRRREVQGDNPGPPSVDTSGTPEETPARSSRRPRSTLATDPLVPEPLLSLWNGLTAPWSDIRRAEERRRSQMLAGLALVLLCGAFVLMFLVPLSSSPGTTMQDRGLLFTNLVVISAGFGIYVISRTRYYEWGAWLVVFGTMAWVSVGVMAAEGTPWAASAPLYLALTVVLSTVLLPLVATLFVVSLNLGLLLAFYRLLPAFGVMELSNGMTFIAISSTVLVVTALVRYFDIRQIEEQSASIQESEERYRSLFEASFEGLALHADGFILEVNQALADMLVTDRQKLVDKPFDGFLRFDEPQEPSLSVQINGCQEAEAVRFDGERFPVEFISKPYRYQGRTVQVTGVRDITERKEMERAREKTRELENLNRRLLEMDQLRTRFLNVASHELNTPITPLRLQVHLLKTQGLGDLNDRQLNAVEILERNLVRLSVLVKDILDVSKIEAGRLRLRKAHAEILQVINDTLDTFEPLAKERDVHLVRRMEEESWSKADSDRIAQVVSNLLSNALKFTEPGGQIVVETVKRDASLFVSVTDDGAGLTREQATRLFRPFEQAHDVMEMTEGGTGLGLYISKGIVEAHGGRMDLESEGPGKGVKVWFTLPFVHPEGPDGSEEPELRTNPTDEPAEPIEHPDERPEPPASDRSGPHQDPAASPA